MCKCTAAELSPEPAPADRDDRADSYLHNRLSVWQDRLHLQDWKLSLVLVHRSDLRPGTLGNTHWDPQSKTAKIRILCVSEYGDTPWQPTVRDMELTLVHELLHVELAALPHSDASRLDEEDAVNRMADALVRLDRGDPGDVKSAQKANLNAN